MILLKSLRIPTDLIALEGDNVNTITITSFSEYISHVEHYYGRNHLFRGLKKKSYPLIPKIGRRNYVQRCSGEAEQQLFELQDLEERIFTLCLR